MSRTVKALIFDMDGVIVDTEPASQKRVLRYLRQYNEALTEKDTSILVGRGSREVWDIITRLSGSGKDPEAMKEEYDRWLPVNGGTINYRAIFRPAVKDVLTYARAHDIKTAVASSTEYRKVKAILTEVGIFDLMDEVVSGEDCTRPKPNPDVYLETAGRLGVTPCECLVIEDSTVGIEAAHRAGTTVAALIDDRFPVDRSKADMEIAEISDIIPFLAVNLEKRGKCID